MLIHLRTANGHYLCAEGGGGGVVDATRTSPAQWETFDMEAVPVHGQPGQFSAHLRAFDGHYLSAEGGGGGAISANRTVAAQWETFIASGDPSNHLTFRTSDGHYVCAEGGGGAVIDATRTSAAQWETFQVEAADVARPPLTTTQFSFTLDTITISNTRSRHVDTDFVTVGAGVPTGATNVIAPRAMGDLNNGTYSVNISTGSMDCSQGLIAHFSVVNSGHSDTSALEKVLRDAAAALIDLAKQSLQPSAPPAPSSPTSPATGSGSDVLVKIMIACGAYIAGQAANAGIAALFANCDGVCAADTIRFSLTELQTLCANGPFSQPRAYPGTDTPGGCGSNSAYTVGFTITPA